MKTVVFVGPSMSRPEVELHTDAHIAEPVCRGDLANYAEFDRFLILDGEFGQNLSVSPKEILLLIDQGKTVMGACSMGALRASELDVFGMIGIGWVYERFRKAHVRQDDDVALLYSPFDLTPLTIPTVDVEYWMDCLCKEGRISKGERSAMLKGSRRVFYAERSWERLHTLLVEVFGEARADALVSSSGGEMPSVKKIDAVAALLELHKSDINEVDSLKR